MEEEKQKTRKPIHRQFKLETYEQMVASEPDRAKRITNLKANIKGAKQFLAEKCRAETRTIMIPTKVRKKQKWSDIFKPGGFKELFSLSAFETKMVPATAGYYGDTLDLGIKKMKRLLAQERRAA